MKQTRTRPEQFWDRMFELYGMKWANSYGAEPTELWINVIDSLEGYRIKWVIKSLMNNGDSFVPTMPQIVALAKSAHKPFNPNRAAIGAENKEYTSEQLDANRRKLKRVTAAAFNGEFKNLEEWQINEIIKDW